MGDIYFQLLEKCLNYLLVSHEYIKDIQVTIARRFHLFPFRTEKLSSVTPMVLRNSGRVGSRRFFREKPLYRKMQGLFLYPDGCRSVMVLCGSALLVVETG